MANVMGILASTMRTDAEALRVIAQNVSSADNVAYRRQILVSRPDFDSLAHSAQAQLLLPKVQTAIDSRPGTLKSTGESLDLAIQGDAYFVVSTAQGELLTRRGDFHVDPTGVLSAFNGDPVLGTEGTIRMPEGTPKIDLDGTVRIGSETVGHLRLEELAPEASVRPMGDALFASQGGAPVASPSAQVHQGFLETSNVSPVNEMLHLLQAVRHFEAGQRFVRTYDEMLDRALSDLGKI
ncbi:MAG TPA: flagellar hook-basal body protein [Steroidobacteraceae bacterium]|jgi:flagellar basal-body rod protein FlgF|nr:flagellar hook-basal body protein [Steroidobacteraceae bacterium]